MKIFSATSVSTILFLALSATTTAESQEAEKPLELIAVHADEELSALPAPPPFSALLPHDDGELTLADFNIAPEDLRPPTAPSKRIRGHSARSLSSGMTISVGGCHYKQHNYTAQEDLVLDISGVLPNGQTDVRWGVYKWRVNRFIHIMSGSQACTATGCPQVTIPMATIKPAAEAAGFTVLGWYWAWLWDKNWNYFDHTNVGFAVTYKEYNEFSPTIEDPNGGGHVYLSSSTGDIPLIAKGGDLGEFEFIDKASDQIFARSVRNVGHGQRMLISISALWAVMEQHGLASPGRNALSARIVWNDNFGRADLEQEFYILNPTPAPTPFPTPVPTPHQHLRPLRPQTLHQPSKTSLAMGTPILRQALFISAWVEE